MSLINDALRRANADKSRPQSAAPVPPMEPVESRPSSSRVLPWALLFVGVGVLGIAAALWFRGRPQSQQVARNEHTQAPATPVASSAVQQEPATRTPLEPETLSTPSVQSQPQPSTPVTVAVNPAATPESPKATPLPESPRPQVESAPAVSAPTTPAPEVAVTTTTPEPAAPTATPVAARSTTPTATAAPQAPRLQAIYYRLRKPTVVINGKTLGLGQSVDGIKVISIQRTSVEVVQDGKYRTLTLQD